MDEAEGTSEEVRMSGSNRISRRDFIKVTTGAVGGLIGAAIGVPAVAYLIDPAFEGRREGSLGRRSASWTISRSARPTRSRSPCTKVNGWERTATSYGGFVMRKSEDPNDILILSSRCTHLGCRVNWNEEKQAFPVPLPRCQFQQDGEVLGGPPPRPLDRYDEFQRDEDGILEIIVARKA